MFAVQENFKLPNYFGFNYDALDECINDLEWLYAKFYLIVFKDSEKILSEEPNAWDILAPILKSTSSEWRNGRNYDDFPTAPTPFHILFHYNHLNNIIIKVQSAFPESNIISINGT